LKKQRHNDEEVLEDFKKEKDTGKRKKVIYLFFFNNCICMYVLCLPQRVSVGSSCVTMAMLCLLHALLDGHTDHDNTHRHHLCLLSIHDTSLLSLVTLVQLTLDLHLRAAVAATPNTPIRAALRRAETTLSTDLSTNFATLTFVAAHQEVREAIQTS
jgi:hypothetical protein